MRIIKSGSNGILKTPVPSGHVESKAPLKPVEATCTACLTVFDFTLLDEGVSLDNERDYNVECPECGTDLTIGAVTGIVVQRNTGG